MVTFFIKLPQKVKISATFFAFGSFLHGCGAATGTGRNRIHLKPPEPYSEYGSGYKEMRQKTHKNVLKV
jgi:hypothetical protein